MSGSLINPGRCPLCVAAGARHKLFIDNEPTPAHQRVKPSEFWDEDARLHVHDPNRYVMHMRCSNNHQFSVTHLSRCPCRSCEWNAQPEVQGGVGWPVPETMP